MARPRAVVDVHAQHRGPLALRRNDLRTARRDLLGLLKEPDPRGWRFALIALANGGREPEASADVLEDLVKAGAIPNQIEAWQEFGRLALRMERPALAKRIVDEVVRRFPKSRAWPCCMPPSCSRKARTTKRWRC